MGQRRVALTFICSVSVVAAAVCPPSGAQVSVAQAAPAQVNAVAQVPSNTGQGNSNQGNAAQNTAPHNATVQTTTARNTASQGAAAATPAVPGVPAGSALPQGIGEILGKNDNNIFSALLSALGFLTAFALVGYLLARPWVNLANLNKR